MWALVLILTCDEPGCGEVLRSTPDFDVARALGYGSWPAVKKYCSKHEQQLLPPSAVG